MPTPLTPGSSTTIQPGIQYTTSANLTNPTAQNFSANVASTPAPGSAPTTPTSAPSILSTDVGTLGQPKINPANLPQPSPYTPSPVPDLASITNQGTAPGEAQNSYDAIGSQIASLTGALGGQSADYSSLQNTYNTPQLTSTANDITANIAQIQSQRDTVQQQLKNQYGNDASKGYLSLEQQSIDSELSAKQSAYSASLAAINGKLSTAQTFIEQAIKNKYEPITAQINALKSQADLVKGTLDREQTKQLAVMQAQLADRANTINANKAISSTMLEKIAVASANSANPAPAYIVSQAQSAALSDNPASALAIIAPYLNDPLQAKMQIADINAKNASATASIASAGASRASAADSYAKANLSNTQASQLSNTTSTGSAIGTTGQTAINATSPGYTSQIVAGGLTQASIDQTAISNIAAAKTINLTSRSSPAMRAIANRMGELAPGGNIQGNKAALTANSAALKQQTEYLNTTTRAFNTANDTLTALQSYMQTNNINPNQFPDYNSFVGYLKSKGLDPGSQGGYNAQITTLRSEYSQVLAKGGVRSVETDNEAKNLIPGNLAPADLAKVATQIKIDGQNVTNDAQKQVSTIQDKINNMISTGANSGGSGTPTPSASTATTLLTGPDGKQYNVPNDKVSAFKAAGGH